MRRLAALLACLWLGCAGAAQAAGRRVVVLIDTSGSMISTDPQRYAAQLAQIVADLLDDSDELTVVRLGGFFLFCGAGPSSSVALRLDPARRSEFKNRLDRMIVYDGENAFAVPIRTAIEALGLDPARKRMLLMIADSGGLAPCEGPLTRELVKLQESGAVVAAVNIGSTTGAFEHNPAFDLTTPAQNPKELVEAVAQVYQRFLGERKVQTGTVQGGGIEVEIDAYVREAFLVVSADGAIGRPEPEPGNPRAAALDPDYRGGGQTVGLDGRTRGYRIVRFERPASGRWRFRVPDLAGSAAWVLIQQDTLGVRLISPGRVATGAASLLQAEIYDTDTGQPVRDLAQIPGAAVSMQVDGKELTLRDDGSDGDVKPGDGIFSALQTFEGTGRRDLPIRLRTRTIDRTLHGELEVVEAGWRVVPPAPRRAELGTPLPLVVDLEPIGAPSAPRVPPERIEVRAGGSLQTELRSGEAAFAPRYQGSWTPPSLGTQNLELVPVGGSPSATAVAQVEVLGKLELGAPVPIRFSGLHGGEEAAAALDLSRAQVKGGFDLEVTSAFDRSGAQLEIETAAGWTPLGQKPVAIRLEEGGPRSWPLRLRVGSCPAACAPSEAQCVVISGVGGDGSPRRLEVPLTAEIIPDPWLECWWPVLAALAGAGLAAFVAYGFWSPSRFAPRVGVVLSQEEDMSEGFFHPIRATKGSGSGFYRDAMVYIGDFRLTPRPAGALARLRAHRNQVRLRPMPGTTLWRQSLDGEWSPLDPDEATVRSNMIYRNDSGTLFFELRNR